MSSSDKKTCPKCDSEMECGMLLDRNYTSCRSQQWQANCDGKGDAYSSLFNVKTMRCTECGFLESYAFEAGPINDDEEESGPPIL